MKQKGRRGVLVERGGTATLFLCLFLILINCTAAQPSLSDRAALLALRSSLGLRAKDWPLKANPCTNWTGVSCQLGRVTRIIVSGLRRTRVGRQRPQFSVDSLANLTALVSFNATGFPLPGSIPDWIGSRVGSLEVLDLRSCGISGAIPGSLGRLRRLKELHLSDNSLTGNLNPFLGQLQSLSVLDLSENFLTGSIPDEFSALTNLTTLDLASNFISGPIPASLASISALRRLNLSYNSLTSAIPTQLSNLSHLVTLDISKNSISGPISLNLIEFKNLKEIRIGENGLNGEIPEKLFSDLSQLTELQIFDASSNNLTGKLPNLNINVTNSVFNFSNNQLYGPIDASWLQMPGSIDLSGNYFQGPISVQANVASLSMNCLQNLTNQRSSTDCRSFYSNQGLVFDEFGSHQPDEPPRTSSGSRNKSWVYVVIGACGAFGVMVVLALLVFIMRRRNTTSDAGPTTAREIPGTPKHPMTLVLPTGDSFTYQQILHATSNFSGLTFIKHGHSGELYQGLLDNRAPVVVKKVASDSLYVAELEFFGRVSHARLVPLLGHCVGAENEKFLVYKYMPNGDLASSFYRPSDNEDDSLRSIDWITRLKIAIGAAEGLAYLHHECSPPIVHRDIQASSILLDDKFEVRLGSLSEIRASDGDPQHGGIKRFLRKQSGTLDQTPTGLSPVACSYDVYCFGKVLLELVTGKIGIGKSDDAALKEWIEHSLTYISVYDKELVTKIIDPSLIVDEDLLEEVWAMAIVARSCLNPKPSKRPLTKYILRALENPLKVVRAESIGSSSRLRTNSSTRSWNAAFLGSWRHSSSDSGLAAGPSRQPARVRSHSSSGNDHSSSNKRLSSEIFPEPISMSDMDRIDH